MFLSIHPYVDGDGLQHLKELLHNRHITFPVMVDSPAPDGKAWGKTSAYYRVYSGQPDVWIDKEGRVARLDLERGWVSENDWWWGAVGLTVAHGLLMLLLARRLEPGEGQPAALAPLAWVTPLVLLKPVLTDLPRLGGWGWPLVAA